MNGKHQITPVDLHRIEAEARRLRAEAFAEGLNRIWRSVAKRRITKPIARNSVIS